MVLPLVKRLISVLAIKTRIIFIDGVKCIYDSHCRVGVNISTADSA